MHAILGDRYKEQRLPWQGLAVSLHGTGSAVEALKVAGLDFTVQKSFLTFSAFGQQMSLPDKAALIRSATSFDLNPATLGFCSSSYQVMQNLDLATALDESGLTALYPVEYVGSCNGGQRVFITLSMGHQPGLPVDGHLFAATGHDGSTPTTIQYVPVLTHSSLPLLIGVKEAGITIRHDQQMFDQATAVQAMTTTAATMNHKLFLMQEHTITKEDAWAAIGAAFPHPVAYGDPSQESMVTRHKTQVTYENAVKRAQEVQEYTWDIYWQRGSFHHTTFGVYQAVCEMSCYREGHESSGPEDNIAVSALFGARSKEMARTWGFVTSKC